MEQNPQAIKKTTRKINLPEGFLTPAVTDLFDCLNKNGAQTLFVGGCVRDAVLGVAAADVDLATTLTPEEATKVLKAAGFKVEPTGLDHGTVMAIKDGMGYEVTTLRQDISTDGRHAEVAFTTDFAADAARRDFTFNAMYMDKQGHITDWFGGMADLEAGHVRFVGTPAQRLQEDWLRALRYIRFYGRFGAKKPDPETKRALAGAAEHLKNLSAERKTTEVLKILLTPKAEAAFLLMQELGFLAALQLTAFKPENLKIYTKIFPEISNPTELLVAGLWDKQTPDLPAKTLLENPHLRLSKKQKGLIRSANAGDLEKVSPENVPYASWLLGGDNASRLWRLQAAFDLEGCMRKKAMAAAHRAQKDTAPVFPLKGSDIKTLGIPEGPETGKALRKTEAWWAERGFPEKSACLAWLSAHKHD